MIAGIIMGSVGSFLVFNVRGFNVTKDIIDIQYEAQLSMNQLSSIAQKSTGIIRLEDDATPTPNDLLTQSTAVTPITLEFHHLEDAGGGVDTTYYYVLTYDPVAMTIVCDVDEDSGGTRQDYQDFPLATFVENFTIEPTDIRDLSANQRHSYADTNSIAINMTFTEGRASYDIQTEVKFRNME